MTAMKKLNFLVSVLAVAAGCCSEPQDGYEFTWKKHVIDGHITGVTAANADNVAEAFGTVEDGVYTAPNGKVFKCGAAPAAAYDMLAVQPQMSDLKQVIGFCEEPMASRRPESNLSDWAADMLLEAVSEVTGRKADFSVINFGGIRTSLGVGEVLKDDLVSMFPFKNYVSYVRLSGKDVKTIFERFASGRVEAFGGARLVVEDGKISSLEIGGKPFDERKEYALATIDFLLDGGDGHNLAKNAKELIITDIKVGDVMLEKAKAFAPSPIAYQVDGRYQVIPKEKAE